MKLIVEDWSPAKVVINRANGLRLRVLMTEPMLLQIDDVYTNGGEVDVELYDQPEGRVFDVGARMREPLERELQKLKNVIAEKDKHIAEMAETLHKLETEGVESAD